MSRVIKRYGNRKYYDLHESRYITLNEIYVLVREGHDVIVTSATQDITRDVLFKALVENEKELNTDLVKSVIKTGDGTLNGFLTTLVNK